MITLGRVVGIGMHCCLLCQKTSSCERLEKLAAVEIFWDTQLSHAIMLTVYSWAKSLLLLCFAVATV